MIYVDKETESKIGDWPINRTYYGKAIEILNEKYKPRMIVLKIFLDSEKPEDKEFAAVLKKHSNVYTQAMPSDEDQPWKGPVPLKVLPQKNPGYQNYNSGWFPNAVIAPYFTGVGFVEGKTSENGEAVGFMMVNSVQNKLYPSLPLVLASAWKNKEVSVDLSKLEKDGSMKLPAFPKTLPWPVYSFSKLLDKSIPENALKDGMVFIFYTGKKAAPMKHNQAEVVAIMTDYLIDH